MLNRLPAPLLGLDIGSSSIKLVELGRDRSGAFTLERCATEPLAAGSIVDGQVADFDAVTQAIRRAVRHSGTGTRQVALALPSSAVITRKIPLPAGLHERELEAQVEAEANRYIPFSLDEVSLDFCMVEAGRPLADPADPAHPSSEVEVLIAASRKERVQERQDLAEAAGLRPVILDIESFAARLAASRLLGAFSSEGPTPVVALFELGTATIGLQVIDGEQVLYERDQPLGGPQLTQEIARALQFFFNSTPHHRVDGVLLAGGGAALPGLVQAVARQTAFSCRLANPFEGMRLAASISPNALRDQAPAYLAACGLALRRFLQ